MVNPDIKFESAILVKILAYMKVNTNVGHLMPKVFYPNGELQYLCKLIPTPFDLFFRRFVPLRFIENRIYRFELRKSGYNTIMDVPYLSGCFMFLRVSALKEIGLFDERLLFLACFA